MFLAAPWLRVPLGRHLPLWQLLLFLRMQVTNGGSLNVSGLPFGFEFAQRNVATSPAINKLFGGGTIRSARMPAE